MGDALMQDDQLEAIAEQVKEKMILWLDEKHIYPFPERSPDISTQLLERMVRVEEGIKHQNETIEKLISQTDRRFTETNETMDRRFKETNETMDRRFKETNETMDRRFTELSVAMDKRFESMDKRFESFDKRFESFDKRFESMDKRFNRLYVFLSGIFLTILAGMIPLIIQGFQT